MTNLISAKNVSVQIGGINIIDSISFNVDEGDIAMIIGPNGSGKSTLLRALLGMMDYKGEVLFTGKKVRSVLKDIGYVPQRFHFDKTFPITVQEFLRLFSEDKAKIEKALEEVDMLRYKNRTLGDMSGGQLQRVLIARAILSVPKLLVLDEPTSGIDMEGVKDFFEIIRHMNKKHGVTIVMVSHEISVVYDIATKVICLNKDLVCFGEPKTALTNDALTKLYGAKVHQHMHK